MKNEPSSCGVSSPETASDASFPEHIKLLCKEAIICFPIRHQP